jgi:hypothetical protein
MACSSSHHHDARALEASDLLRRAHAEGARLEVVGRGARGGVLRLGVRAHRAHLVGSELKPCPRDIAGTPTQGE